MGEKAGTHEQNNRTDDGPRGLAAARVWASPRSTLSCCRCLVQEGRGPSKSSRALRALDTSLRLERMHKSACTRASGPRPGGFATPAPGPAALATAPRAVTHARRMEAATGRLPLNRLHTPTETQRPLCSRTRGRRPGTCRITQLCSVAPRRDPQANRLRATPPPYPVALVGAVRSHGNHTVRSHSGGPGSFVAQARETLQVKRAFEGASPGPHVECFRSAIRNTPREPTPGPTGVPDVHRAGCAWPFQRPGPGNTQDPAASTSPAHPADSPAGSPGKPHPGRLPAHLPPREQQPSSQTPATPASTRTSHGSFSRKIRIPTRSCRQILNYPPIRQLSQRTAHGSASSFLCTVVPQSTCESRTTPQRPNSPGNSNTTPAGRLT